MVLEQSIKVDLKMEPLLLSKELKRLDLLLVLLFAEVTENMEVCYLLCSHTGQSVYDKHLGAEFQSEIKTLTEVGHLNLVKFYGYLVHEDEKLVVVEYVPNGTLREHLECKYSLAHYLVDVCECLFLFPFYCLWWVWGIRGGCFTVFTCA